MLAEFLLEPLWQNLVILLNRLLDQMPHLLFVFSPGDVDAAWQEVGRADGVVTLATLNGALLAVSVDKKLLWKAPDNLQSSNVLLRKNS